MHLFLKLFILFSLFFYSSLFSKTNLRFATLAPKSSTWGKLIKEIARDTYKKSNKDFIIKVFYGGVQGDEKEMEEKIRFNQIDGGFFTGNGLGAVSPEARILEIPGTIKTYQEVDYVYQGITKDLNIYFNQRGYVLLGLLDVGYAYFYSQKNIKSIKDIQSTKMWRWKGDKLSAKIMQKLNIPAIPVNFTEVVPSLETRLIDGVYSTPTALISLQWHTKIKYMLDLPITLVSSGIVLSKKTWDKLSKEQQTILSTVIANKIKLFKPKLRQADKTSINLLKQQNIIINKVNNQQNINNMNTLLANFPQKLQTKMQQLLKEIRK